MKKLNIQVTKAQFVSFFVQFDPETFDPKVTVTLALLTEGGRKISEYTIFTESWNDENKFELPMDCIPHLAAVAKVLEGVATRHCNDSTLALPAAEI